MTMDSVFDFMRIT